MGERRVICIPTRTGHHIPLPETQTDILRSLRACECDDSRAFYALTSCSMLCGAEIGLWAGVAVRTFSRPSPFTVWIINFPRSQTGITERGREKSGALATLSQAGFTA